MIIDTHIFLWWLFDDNRLPDRIRKQIENINHAIFVSAASVWEITTKFRIGKLQHASEVAKNVPGWILKAGFQPLAVTPEHAQLAGSWDIMHRDPFDRVLAAQSRLERMPLVSTDKAVRLFPIKVIWC
jgi:PIN domain nuclease of toxin-antitoxin system